MAKTTRAEGPTFTPEEGEALEYVPKRERVRRAEVGAMPREKGEKSSPGNNSTASTREPSGKDKTRKEESQEPAPDVVNPSPQTVTEDDADSTGGDGPKTEKESSSSRPRKATGATKSTKARATTLDDPDDF